MDLEGITPDGLSSLLVGKHDNFIKEYKSELKILERMMVVNETMDQLDHWVQEGSGDLDKHIKNKERAEKELSDLRGQLPYTNPENRLKDLKNRIEEHRKALEFWKNERRRTKEDS